MPLDRSFRWPGQEEEALRKPLLSGLDGEGWTPRDLALSMSPVLTLFDLDSDALCFRFVFPDLAWLILV